jgi:hypothetical protein
MTPAFGSAAELAEIDRRLSGKPGDVELLFARAWALDLLGRNNEARDAYVEVIKRDAAHLGALSNLGTLLYNAGFRSAARLTYAEALNHHPDDVTTLVNYGNALLDAADAPGAAASYERALGVDPQSGAAHQGLSHALAALGREAEAARHRRLGFTLAPVAVSAFRGNGSPVSVLVLSSALRGNVATEAALDDRTFLVVKLFADYYDPSLPLPPHDVIVNAIGDADLCAASLDAAQTLLRKSSASVINAPERIRGTGRVAIAERMRGIDGLIVPSIAQYDRAAVSSVPLPILLRAPGFHTGEHFELVRTHQEREAALASMPGEHMLAIQMLDARGHDGTYWKYRVLCVGGRFYPVHLARSSHWKVHYFSADLAQTPDAIAEEEAFLRDMPAALPSRARRALEAIRDRMELDYFGIDFALDAGGNVLLFEANAAMRAVVSPPDATGDARRQAALAANGALRDLVLRATKS